jgi:exosortase A-associated hydrolase 2
MTSIEAFASQTPVSPGRPALPHAFFLDAPDGSQRFCLFHTPQPGTPIRGRVLFCHPFAEEINTTRRTVARQARAMAEAGFAVMQIDLLGCGDSTGDFADAAWPAWLADLRLAHAWLSDQQRNTGGPLWLWGLRAGALLASDLAATLPEPANLLLWQPFTSGQQQLQQFLRLHSAGQWLAGDQKDTVKKLDKPAQQLAQGQPVHIAGYSLSPLLAQGMAASKLQPPSNQAPGRLVWLELGTQAASNPAHSSALSPAADKQIAAWQQTGWQVSAKTVATPAFWQTVDTEAAPELTPATLAALATAPTEQTGAAEAPPA